MDNYSIVKQVQILEEYQKTLSEIQNLIIEKKQSCNMFDEKLKVLYSRVERLNRELKSLMILPNDKDDPK
jgi:protein subunit release factor A